MCGAQSVQYPVIGANSIAAGLSADVLISRDWQGSGFCVMDGETHVRVEVEATCIQTLGLKYRPMEKLTDPGHVRRIGGH